MKALQIYSPGSVAGIKYEEIPTPAPATGEVLVQVYASGLSPQEITWSSSRECGIDVWRQRFSWFRLKPLNQFN